MHARAVIFAGAALAATSLGSAAERSPLQSFQAGNLDFQPAAPNKVAGLPKDVVAARLGMPSQVLSREVWIYREFRSDYQEANQRGFDTLVIVFAGDRVRQMRIVNGVELDAMLEANHRAQQRAQVAQATPRVGQ